uniref:Transmembrane protein n=1 Tax=Arundo donax TaxID=35708 RepID=A0A0A9EFG8_ARUDO
MPVIPRHDPQESLPRLLKPLHRGALHVGLWCRLPRRRSAGAGIASSACASLARRPPQALAPLGWVRCLWRRLGLTFIMAALAPFAFLLLRCRLGRNTAGAVLRTRLLLLHTRRLRLASFVLRWRSALAAGEEQAHDGHETVPPATGRLVFGSLLRRCRILLLLMYRGGFFRGSGTAFLLLLLLLLRWWWRRGLFLTFSRRRRALRQRCLS